MCQMEVCHNKMRKQNHLKVGKAQDVHPVTIVVLEGNNIKNSVLGACLLWVIHTCAHTLLRWFWCSRQHVIIEELQHFKLYLRVHERAGRAISFKFMSVVLGNTEMTELLNYCKRRDTVQNPPLKIMNIAICPLTKGSSNANSLWISRKHTSAGLGDVQHLYTENLWSKQPWYWQLGNRQSEREYGKPLHHHHHHHYHHHHLFSFISEKYALSCHLFNDN